MAKGVGGVRQQARAAGFTVRNIPAGSRLAEQGYRYLVTGGATGNANIVARNARDLNTLVGNAIRFQGETAARRSETRALIERSNTVRNRISDLNQQIEGNRPIQGYYNARENKRRKALIASLRSQLDAAYEESKSIDAQLGRR